MTVATTNSTQSFAGGQSVLTFNFRTLVSHPEYVQVSAISGSTIVSLTYSTQYTVTVSSTGIGGTVIVTPSYGSNYNYVVYRLTAVLQNSAYADYNTFPSSTLENNLDQLTMVDQEAINTSTLALTFPIGTSSSYSTIVPLPVANQSLAWDSTGTKLINSSLTGSTGAIGPVGPSGPVSSVSSSTSDVTIVSISTTPILTQINAGTGSSQIMRVTASGYSPLYYPYIKVSETQVSGTNGGTSLTGSWLKRTLNTIDNDTANLLGGTLSNQIMILPLGTYLIKARCPFLNTINTQIRLLNSTSTAVLLTGSSLFESSAAVVAFASLEGLFSLTTTSSVCIQYQCSNSQANNGLGSATSFGTEVFSVAEIIKIV